MIPVRRGGEILVAERAADFPSNLRKPTAAELDSVVDVKPVSWPGVQGLHADGSVATGPTGQPWVNSNAASIRIAQFKNSGKQLWVGSMPRSSPRAEEFVLAVADAAQCGAQWIVAEGGDAKRVQAALQFFAQHRKWTEWEPVGALGIVSDFEAPIEREFLNLAARRGLSTRILDQRKPQGLAGLKALFWLREKPPDEKTLRFFTQWAELGNLLLLPHGSKVDGAATEEHGHKVYKAAKARIAVPLEVWADPYALVHQTHLLLSRRYDVMRLWNGGSLNPYYTQSADEKRAVIQLVNYTARSTSNVTLGLDKKFRKARLHTFEDVRELKIEAARTGVEIPLPPVGVYAAIEVEL